MLIEKLWKYILSIYNLLICKFKKDGVAPANLANVSLHVYKKKNWPLLAS